MPKVVCSHSPGSRGFASHPGSTFAMQLSYGLRRGLHSLFDAGPLVCRFQFDRKAKATAEPQRECGKGLSQRDRFPPHVQDADPVSFDAAVGRAA
jgi:hypothetical protein